MIRISRSFSDASTFFNKHEQVSPSSTLPRLGFTRFEEKKRHNKEVQLTPVKSLFRKTTLTPTKQSSPSSQERSRPVRSVSPDSHSATQQLGQFLGRLPQAAAHHSYMYLRSRTEKLERMMARMALPSDISEKVHLVYQNFSVLMKDHVAFSGI